MVENGVEILLVEDDPQDVKMVLRELERANVKNRIVVARDGEEALDFLFCRGAYKDRSSVHLPRLILLDLKLPKVDGLQVLQEVKANPETKTIPVVVMTSSGEQRDLVESYKLGVNSYIQKPVDFDKFRETIKTLGYYWLVVNRVAPDNPFTCK